MDFYQQQVPQWAPSGMGVYLYKHQHIGIVHACSKKYFDEKKLLSSD